MAVEQSVRATIHERQRRRLALGLGLAAGGWSLLVMLVALGIGNGNSAFDPGYLLLCLLLLAAPLAAALPAGLVLRAPLWTAEAVIAWAVLGYLLLFVDPRVIGRGLALTLFLPACAGVLASPALLWTAWCGGNRRVRRWAYAVTLVPVGLLLLAGIDAFTPLTGALVLSIATALWRLVRYARPRGGAAPEPVAGALGEPALANV